MSIKCIVAQSAVILLMGSGIIAAAGISSASERREDPRNSDQTMIGVHEDSPVQLVVELRDGSRLIGLPQMKDFPVQTSYAKLNVSLKLIETIEFNEDHETVVVKLQNGDQLQGVGGVKSIKLKTPVGMVTVPDEQVVRVSVTLGGDNSVAHALQFNTQNYAQSEATTNLFPSSAITIEFCIKTSFNGSHGAWVVSTRLPDETRGGWYIDVGNGSSSVVGFVCDGWDGEYGPYFRVTSTTAIGDNTWHHIACTYDGSVARLFIDGVQENAQHITGNLLHLSRPLTINAPSAYLTPFQMNEVRFSSTVRYSSNFTPASSFTVDSKTLGYWKFNEGSGKTVHDKAGKNDLMLHGDPPPVWLVRK